MAGYRVMNLRTGGAFTVGSTTWRLLSFKGDGNPPEHFAQLRCEETGQVMQLFYNGNERLVIDEASVTIELVRAAPQRASIRLNAPKQIEIAELDETTT